ncbi:MazG-like family protein [Nonomuraea typhae]|uniref:MazG-like family protein n=1 Tax=Nonomuraea typhae TaxID=2603600 RepID=UPI0015E1D7C7|nr:MazG-like family protein [Nonomuraea typhae]
MTTPTIAQHVAVLLAWLDATNPRTDHEISMRIMKIGEEYGEAVAAYIGMTGQNPRKGVTHTRDDLTTELCDVIVTAMVALASVAGDADRAGQLIDEHLTKRFARLIERIHAAEPCGHRARRTPTYEEEVPF